MNTTTTKPPAIVRTKAEALVIFNSRYPKDNYGAPYGLFKVHNAIRRARLAAIMPVIKFNGIQGMVETNKHMRECSNAGAWAWCDKQEKFYNAHQNAIWQFLLEYYENNNHGIEEGFFNGVAYMLGEQHRFIERDAWTMRSNIAALFINIACDDFCGILCGNDIEEEAA